MKRSLVRNLFAAFQTWLYNHQHLKWLYAVMLSFFERVVSLRMVFRTFFHWSARVRGQKLLHSGLALTRVELEKPNNFLHALCCRAPSLVSICFSSWRALLVHRERFERLFRFLEPGFSGHVLASHFAAWRCSALAVQRARSSCSRPDIDAQVRSIILFCVDTCEALPHLFV
jgi:hypothetical protein